MSAQFITLEDAAKKLGVSIDELVEMRSRGDIFGYRDGASWKFKPEEIERVASEMMGGALDEDPAGSSILISEQELGLGSTHGSALGSDISLDEKKTEPDSDVALVPDAKSGSDVRLVPSKPIPISDDDDDELTLQTPEDELMSASGLGSDIKFATSDDSAIKIGSGTGAGSDIPLAAGSSLDLELSDQDDLVLGAGSDLALGNDSGINLMSPSDSGISLEDEPLDLAASGISGLDLATEGSDVAGSAVGSAVGSGIDFQKDEEFQLSASGAIETDEDSGSQVIELEDSSEFGDAAVALPASDGFDVFGDADPNASMELGAALGGAAASSARIPAAPDLPYSTPQVVFLLLILLLMCTSGILVSDIVRNMWASSGASDMTSGFTSAILSAIGKGK